MPYLALRYNSAPLTEKKKIILTEATGRYHPQGEKKKQKFLPPFGWDTESVTGTELIYLGSIHRRVLCSRVWRWTGYIGRKSSEKCNWAL
jgi:hypothetical protein